MDKSCPAYAAAPGLRRVSRDAREDCRAAWCSVVVFKLFDMRKRLEGDVSKVTMRCLRSPCRLRFVLGVLAGPLAFFLARSFVAVPPSAPTAAGFRNVDFNATLHRTHTHARRGNHSSAGSFPKRGRDEALIADFFITRDDEIRRPFKDSTAPGFPQPIPIFATGRLVRSYSEWNASHVLCFHSRTTSGGICGRGSVSYTHIRQDQVFTCGDVLDVPARPGCSMGFGDAPEPAPSLLIKGPSFIFHRTAHLPHFLEEVASGANWLHRNNMSHFSVAVIDETGGTCATHPGYRSGSWAPTGSPISESLQIAMAKTIAKAVIFSWGVRPKQSVCVEAPWRDAHLERKRHSERFFGHPLICARFRERALAGLGVAYARRSTALHVLVLQRSSGGRRVRNLADLATIGLQQELNLTFRFSSLDGFSAQDQARELAQADVLVAHHGNAVTLAIFMPPGSLVVEIFNYMTTCDFFQGLLLPCGTNVVQLFNKNGTNYGRGRCNGNNRKDSSDDASADLTEISRVLRRHVQQR